MATGLWALLGKSAPERPCHRGRREVSVVGARAPDDKAKVSSVPASRTRKIHGAAGTQGPGRGHPQQSTRLTQEHHVPAGVSVSGTQSPPRAVLPMLNFGGEGGGCQAHETQMGRPPSLCTQWFNSAEPRGAVLGAGLRAELRGCRRPAPAVPAVAAASPPRRVPRQPHSQQQGAGAKASVGVRIGILFFRLAGCGLIRRVPLLEEFGHVVEDQVEVDGKHDGGKETKHPRCFGCPI